MLTGFLTFLDVIVIGLCCISLLLTFGSLRRALKLARVGKFAMQQRTFSRNSAKTGLGIHFLPHFCTVQLFIIFPILFHIPPFFLFFFNCYTLSLSLPSFCLLSLSLLTLPPLFCLVAGNGKFLQKWAQASPQLVGPPPPLLSVAPLQCYQWPGDNSWNLAQDSTQLQC